MEFRLSYRCRYCGDDIPALYDPSNEVIELYLSHIRSRKEDELISKIIGLINHEVMHHVFKLILGEPSIERIKLEHKIMEKVGI